MTAPPSNGDHRPVLAHHLAPATGLLPGEKAEAWAAAWLRHRSGWLLVLDNVEDPAHIDLAVGYSSMGRAADALALCRRAARIAEDVLPTGHPSTAIYQQSLERLQQAVAQREHSE